MTESTELDALAHSAIVSTERLYREQIFASGCSSSVPIYRISQNAKVDALKQMLNGSPYVQKDIEFSERVIAALIDVNLYCFEGKHFFFQGDMPREVQEFVNEHCEKIESLADVAESGVHNECPEWCDFRTDLPKLLRKYPVLRQLDIPALTKQLYRAIKHVYVPQNVQRHLELFHQDKWLDRLQQNQSTLFFMLEMANHLALSAQEMTDLVLLGMLKDIGYTRLSQDMDSFETLHPLVTHELVVEANKHATDEEIISDGVLSAILLQHEFTDSTGPLSRMRHPIVSKELQAGMPKVAQISGLCDLFFGFLKDYSPSLAFAITCGFVLGQGSVAPRYEPEVIRSFSDIFNEGEYKSTDVPEQEANRILSDVLSTLKDPAVRSNAIKVINSKTETWYERITLALNIVRNIANNQPDQMKEQSLMHVLNLPEEFGLNY